MSQVIRDIVLIDDKPYGLPQIQAAIPPGRRRAYRVLYFSTWTDYRASIEGRPRVVLLDYCLDLDGLYGNEIVHEIEADVIIGFSSALGGSEAIVEAAREHDAWDQVPELYAVQKRRDDKANRPLAALFGRIL